MKKVILIALFISLSQKLFPQKIQSIYKNELKNPLVTNYGIVFTLNSNSSLYLEQNGKTVLLNTSPGCGMYYTLSKDNQTVGYKYINQNGKQIPALMNLSSKEITYLHSPVKEAGQVSFADNGTIAFTIRKDLIVNSASGKREYSLGNYSNIAPISPDAQFAAFNNNNDQIFILNLATGKREKITDNSSGYFYPVWSPDSRKLLYSSLDAKMKVYDLDNGETYSLGKGFSPSWSYDSHLIIFYRKEIKRQVLINSDIYTETYNGTTIKQLTFTSGELEIDPSFAGSDSQIVYSLAGNETVIRAAFSPINLSIINEKKITLNINPVKLPVINSIKSVKVLDTINVPYINQLYDTPDYFNGSAACGPTSAMMVLAYYNILPVWSIHCTYPYGHYSKWGRYISDFYRFRQVNYDFKANDPSGRPAEGAFGFMWSGSNSPYSTMVDYFRSHGLSASRTDAPPYSAAYNQVSAGNPYVICVGLTSVGHIVVADGTTPINHTLIFNDPYGNKNMGYSNYSGRFVTYDWPGYNNGYQNLTTVYWSVAVNYNMPAPADTLVDDIYFGNGFYLNTKSPSSMSYWKDLNVGYNNHAWYALSTDSSSTDSCYAVWTPNLQKPGYYKVSAYIPFSQTEAADYKINTADGLKYATINQEAAVGTWAMLGLYKFDKGSMGYVKLDNKTPVKGQTIVYDAVKWSYIDSTATAVNENVGVLPDKFLLYQNYPNPFNPATEIKFQIPAGSFVTLKIYDMLGNIVKTLVDEYKPEGNYSVSFDGNSLASGVYFYRLQAGKFVSFKKMILLK